MWQSEKRTSLSQKQENGFIQCLREIIAPEIVVLGQLEQEVKTAASLNFFCILSKTFNRRAIFSLPVPATAAGIEPLTFG
jgi:hypothetical protein